jgi:uncharacterized protein
MLTDDTKYVDAISRAKRWLLSVVIGLNFCPFAKKEFERNSIRFHVDAGLNEKSSLDTLLDELTLLDGDPSIETTLIIYPDTYHDFHAYLNWVDMAMAIVENGAYRGIYQIASFHPDYCFADSSADDPANFTNRSPFPMLHILRESSLSRVLEHFPNPEQIPERNILKARDLGLEALQALLK